MSEMLANQYFMARKYDDACPLLENALEHASNKKAILRKLIICYTQTSQFDQALDMFLDLISQDIHFIIDADPIYDDCPCPELVGNDFMEIDEENEYEYNLAHGIIWLYCDVHNSLDYFHNLTKQQKNLDKINLIISIIEEHIKDLKTH